MTIEIRFYDEPVTETENLIIFPDPPTGIIPDSETLAEAMQLAVLTIAVGQVEGHPNRSAMIVHEGTMWMGFVMLPNRQITRVITPASEAWLDEHDLTWRMRAQQPLNPN